MSQTWERCLKTLKDSIPLTQFSVWILPLKVIENSNSILLLPPSNSALSYINKNLKQEIKRCVAMHNKDIKLYIKVSQEKPKTKSRTSSPLSPEYSFANLVLGNANQMAYSAAKQIAQNIKSSPYNPFIIYGASGLGKTHLMQATGHLAQQQNPQNKIIYTPLMNFVRHITSSLRYNTIDNVKAYYQSADLLLVDDIHLIAGKEKSQEEFFHIFNFLFNTKKQIIFTCDQLFNNIKTLEYRLKTRFSQGLNLRIEPPELEMRAAILLKKSQNKKINLNLSEDIALFVASHITSNVRDLEGALLKIKAYMDFSHNKHTTITKDIIEVALEDIIKPTIKNIDINDIQKEVAKHYAVTISDLNSKSRKQQIVIARQLAMFLISELTMLSLTTIGKNFGNRDHSTVIHAIKKIKQNIENDNKMRSNYDIIKLKLANL